MKLLNPTDDQLNAAFAEKVAGWKRLDCDLWDVGLDISSPWCRKRSDGIWISNRTAWTESADAVLPWLEKHRVAPIAEYRPTVRAPAFTGWEIMLEHGCNGRASTFPRAAVIALLRANGVEVEFA